MVEDPLGKLFWAKRLQALTHADGRAGALGKHRYRGRFAPRRPRKASDDRVAVHDDVGQEPQQARRAIPPPWQLEQLGRLVDKPGCAASIPKGGMFQQADQEGDIRLHAADSELMQASVHPLDGVHEPATASGDFDEHRIVVRMHDRTRKGAAGVQSNPHAAGRAIVRNPAVVRQKVIARVFGRHAALQRESIQFHVILRWQADRGVAEWGALSDQKSAPSRGRFP